MLCDNRPLPQQKLIGQTRRKKETPPARVGLLIKSNDAAESVCDVHTAARPPKLSTLVFRNALYGQPCETGFAFDPSPKQSWPKPISEIQDGQKNVRQRGPVFQESTDRSKTTLGKGRLVSCQITRRHQCLTTGLKAKPSNGALLSSAQASGWKELGRGGQAIQRMSYR
jgi:hypothetical protein